MVNHFNTEHLLQARNLAKQKKVHFIVKDCSLQLKSKEIVGLLGPNGAGKTTSFYMLVGLLRSDSGEILLDGQKITKLRVEQRAKKGIAYLPQEPSIFRKLTVSQNIEAILELQDHLNRKQRKIQLESLLEEFRIGSIRDQMGLSLSGGERRRVEIARALALDPFFMLLDEPFAGIDPISILDLQHMLSSLSQKGMGIMISDHNVRETLGICQRAYIVAQGTIVMSGNPQEILEHQEVRRIYLGSHFDL